MNLEKKEIPCTEIPPKLYQTWGPQQTPSPKCLLLLPKPRKLENKTEKIIAI